jgi:hypothetical protein
VAVEPSTKLEEFSSHIKYLGRTLETSRKRTMNAPHYFLWSPITFQVHFEDTNSVTGIIKSKRTMKEDEPSCPTIRTE